MAGEIVTLAVKMVHKLLQGQQLNGKRSFLSLWKTCQDLHGKP